MVSVVFNGARGALHAPRQCTTAAQRRRFALSFASQPLQRNSRAIGMQLAATGSKGSGRAMPLYHSFQGLVDAAAPLRAFAQAMHEGMRAGWRDAPIYPASKLFAMYELIGLAGLSHARPAFGIDGATEEVVLARPFGSLLHFRKAVADPDPRVLVVAPM